MNIKKIVKAMLGIHTQDAEYLRSLGARIGDGFSNYGTVDIGHDYLFSAGNNVTLADACKVLMHDGSTQFQLGYSRVGCVNIGNEVFVGVGA